MFKWYLTKRVVSDVFEASTFGYNDVIILRYTKRFKNFVISGKNYKPIKLICIPSIKYHICLLSDIRTRRAVTTGAKLTVRFQNPLLYLTKIKSYDYRFTTRKVLKNPGPELGLQPGL